MTIANNHSGDAPLRVLQVTARYYPLLGGVEMHVHEVARRLAAAGVSVTVATTDTEGNLPTEERAGGVTVRRVRAWPRGRDYYFAPALYGLVASGRWDVVHCQGYHTLVPPVAMLAALRAGVPYVVSFHSGGSSSQLRTAARGVQQRLLGPLLRRASRLIAVSEYEMRLFGERLRPAPGKLVLVPNGAAVAEIDDPPQPDPQAPLIVSSGRLERYKGHHRLIAAMPHLLAHAPGARLRIAGGGSYEAELRRQAAALGVADRVEIAPVPPSDRGGMARLLASASVVALLSDYEAHPLALMEALAAGSPVLVARTSGLTELADRGMARGVAPESSPAQIAAALLAQIEQPITPSRVAVPTWNQCIADLLRIYHAAAHQSNDSIIAGGELREPPVA